MNNPKKILVITPRFPYPEAGADEQDRAGGIRQLVRLGYKVRVVAKFFDWQDKEKIKDTWSKLGVSVTLVPYCLQKNEHSMQRLCLYAKYFDGSTLEFAEPQMQLAVARELKECTPDVVWFDYTYLNPLYHLVKKAKLPIVTRSINYEPKHYLDENGRSLVQYGKYLGKVRTEKNTVAASDLFFSITPAENKVYEKLSKIPSAVHTLPLRSLANVIGTHTPKKDPQLNLFFAGSTYTVEHNRRAAEFVITELAPALWSAKGSSVTIHIFGAKLPNELLAKLLPNTVYRGFVPEWENALQEMDIALAPSFFGAGMQQKVFEPLTRGFPTITNERALAGYPFESGVEYLRAENCAEYLSAITELTSYETRRRYSAKSKEKSATLFSQAALDTIVSEGLETLFTV